MVEIQCRSLYATEHKAVESLMKVIAVNALYYLRV